MSTSYRTGNVGQRDSFRSSYRAASVGYSVLPKSQQYGSSSSSTSFHSALSTTSSVGSLTQLNRAGSMGPSNKYNGSGYRSSNIFNSRGMSSSYQDYSRVSTNKYSSSDRLNGNSNYRTTGNLMSSSYSSAYSSRNRLNSGGSGIMSSSLSSQKSTPSRSFSYNSDMSRSLIDTSTSKRDYNTGNKLMSMSSYVPSTSYASTGNLFASRLRSNHLTSTSSFRNSNRESNSSSFGTTARTKQSTVDNIDDAYSRICNRYGPSSSKTESPISTPRTTTTINHSCVLVQDETKAALSQTVESEDELSSEEVEKLPLSLKIEDVQSSTQTEDANETISTATAINVSDNSIDTTIDKTHQKLDSLTQQKLPTSPKSTDSDSQQTSKIDPFLTDLLSNQRPLQAPDTQLQKMLRLVNFDQSQFQQKIRRADATRRASADKKPEHVLKPNESKSLTSNSTVSNTTTSKVSTKASKTTTISTAVTSTLVNTKSTPVLKPTLKSATSRKETLISKTTNGKMDSKLRASNGSAIEVKPTNRPSTTTSKTKDVESSKVKAINSANRPSKLPSLSNGNRTQRAERTLDSLVAKLDRIQKEQKSGVKTAATMIISEASNSADRSVVNTQTTQQFNKPQLPLLFVTQPTAPSTPMSTTSNVTWTVKEVGRSESSSGTEEDEEYTTDSYEDEDYEDEDDWEDEYDASLTISISADGLHPEDTTKTRKRSVTPDYECEFDLPLMVAATVEPRHSLGGRTDQLNVLQPPPMFTASVTWDREDGMDEETEEFYAKLDQNEDDEDVNVGCTLSLLDRAAIQDSDEYTTDSEYESEYYEDEYDSDLTDEEEYSEEEISASSADAELNIALPSQKLTELPETIQTLSNPKTRSPSPLVKDNRPVGTVQPTPVASDVKQSLLEDKSAIRKATVNMSLEEQRKAEQLQQELNRQKARANGSVSAMRDRFRQPTPPKVEPITYKRSAMLDKKEVERPKRTYAIVKPMINDDFDKQIAELREQMKNKSSQLHNEYKDLSRGIHDKLDQEKLRTMKMEHRELLGKAKDTFSRADEERLIWQQQHISDVEKKHREKLEREKQKQLEQKKLAEEKAAAAAAADTRKVTRRVRRIGDPKAAEIKESEVESLETRPSTAAISQIKTTVSPTPHKTAFVPEKKVLSPTENKLETPPIESNAERRKSIPTNRRKTMELIRPLDVAEEIDLNDKQSKARKRKHQSHRQNRFVRKPFDIDDLLGLSAFTDFEQMDSYFACEIEYKRPAIELEKPKKRRVDAQKIWISQLKDIDKLYKTSELRDIKLDGLS